MAETVFRLAITRDFASGFYGGTGASAEVPGLFPVAINGNAYMVDEDAGNDFATQGVKFRMQSLDIIRQQADNSNVPSEATITPEGTWRRAAEDWSHGAGQTFRDHTTNSDASRFRSSKGVDVWDRFQLTLLPATDNKLVSAATNLPMTPAGARLYVGDNQTTKFTTDVTAPTPVFTGVTGTPAQALHGFATDGTNVWVNYAGGSGIYATTTSSTTAAAYVTAPVTGPIGYVKGRLMAADGASLYNVIAGGALPSALFTSGNSAFRWVGFAEGPGQIYAAGFAGDRSLIYRTQVKTDGTTLDAPVVAGELPSGEVVRSIYGYLGFILVGSDLGVRFASADANGDLTIGALIPTPQPVFGFTAADRFVWFGWSDYDNTSTGLGRLDLSVFTQAATPAYASDLMCDGQGNVLALATFQERTVYSVSGLGVFAGESTPVSSGSVDSGLITYGIPDAKVAMFVDVNCDPLDGTIEVMFAADGGAFVSAGTLDAQGSVATTFSTNQSRAFSYETRTVLTPSAGISPTLRRTTLRVYPAPTVGFEHIVPIILHQVVNIDGIDHHYDIPVERERFRNLANSRALVSYQEAGTAHTVFVDKIAFIHHHRTLDGKNWDGLLVLTLKELPE